MRDLLGPDAGLDLVAVAGRAGLERAVHEVEVQRPALILGVAPAVRPGAVHVLGRGERQALGERGASGWSRLVAELAGAPCLVLCGGGEAPAALAEAAEDAGLPLLLTPLSAGPFARALHERLQRHLSPRRVVHGVLVQVHSLGVLLLGPSGVGKSETALELILRGHRLVADDAVELARAGEALVGEGREPVRHYLEIRGLGVLHAGDLFGQASTVDRCRVGLVVELVPWERAVEVDRTGVAEKRRAWLGVAVPAVEVPVSPGRNLATIVEVAVRNEILRARGVHSALRFEGELRAALSGEE